MINSILDSLSRRQPGSGVARRLSLTSLSIDAVLLIGSTLLASPILARQTPVNLTSRQAPVQISMMALYQSYEEDSLKIEQLSIPITITAPLGRRLNVTLSARQGNATGDDLESLSGLSDAQLTLGYATPLGSSSLAISLGLNLPSGKQELTAEEFQTLILISQTAFDFRTPSLGQGFGFSPGFTLALPVSENLVLGLGASYRVRGGFKPVDGMEEDYTPGNELLLTTGLDTRLGSTTSLSIDATFAQYAADKLGDDQVFEAGSKTTFLALIRHVMGFNDVRLLGLYRAREKSSQLGGSALNSMPVQTIPNEFMVHVSYGLRMNARLRLRLQVEGRFFDETPAFQARDVFDIGILPTYRLSRESSFVARVIYTTGTITGIEGGAGLVIQL